MTENLYRSVYNKMTRCCWYYLVVKLDRHRHTEPIETSAGTSENLKPSPTGSRWYRRWFPLASYGSGFPFLPNVLNRWTHSQVSQLSQLGHKRQERFCRGRDLEHWQTSPLASSLSHTVKFELDRTVYNKQIVRIAENGISYYQFTDNISVTRMR